MSVYDTLKSGAISSDNLHTHTFHEQQKCEDMCVQLLAHTLGDDFFTIIHTNDKQKDTLREVKFERQNQISYLRQCMKGLPKRMIGLDASRSWFAFWVSHSLNLLRDFHQTHDGDRVKAFIKQLEHPSGGYGGGPGQLPHLAPTYSSIMALATTAREDALLSIDRQKVYDFFIRMKDPNTGGFRVHEDGEVDVRGTYCALATASLLHIVTDDLTEGVLEYLSNLQTWEGGFGGEYGMEAHGGYSYCAFAALCILNKYEHIDPFKFADWLSHRHMAVEGGFQGRTNKLVDACYSFWQGAVYPLLNFAMSQIDDKIGNCFEEEFGFAVMPLQMYLLICGTAPNGGMRDKPGCNPDCYHTCYALSGLSLSNHVCSIPRDIDTEDGRLHNINLKHTDIFYNISVDRVQFARSVFAHKPFKVVTSGELGYEGAGPVAYSNKHG